MKKVNTALVNLLSIKLMAQCDHKHQDLRTTVFWNWYLTLALLPLIINRERRCLICENLSIFVCAQKQLPWTYKKVGKSLLKGKLWTLYSSWNCTNYSCNIGFSSSCSVCRNPGHVSGQDCIPCSLVFLLVCNRSAELQKPLQSCSYTSDVPLHNTTKSCFQSRFCSCRSMVNMVFKSWDGFLALFSRENIGVSDTGTNVVEHRPNVKTHSSVARGLMCVWCHYCYISNRKHGNFVSGSLPTALNSDICSETTKSSLKLFFIQLQLLVLWHLLMWVSTFLSQHIFI